MPGDRETGREIERIEMKKAPLLRRAALKIKEKVDSEPPKLEYNIIFFQVISQTWRRDYQEMAKHS